MKNIFGNNILFEKKLEENFFFEKYFWQDNFDKNISGENIFDENIFCKNIFDENILNIFFLPFPHLTALQTTPTSFQLLNRDFWSKVWRNEGRTYGPDGAMFVPFIVLDCTMLTSMDL